MAKFKCTSSGNVYEFTAENDIKDMRKHPDYVEIEQEVEQEAPSPKVGRPKKVVEEE